MRIILVSHGETETHKSSNGAGPLTTTGVQQAEALAHELRTTVVRRSAIEKVYAGETQAATATAAIIATHLELSTPEPAAGLMPQATTLLDATLEHDATVEAMRAVQDEAWAVIERLRDAHPDEAAQIIAVAPALTVHAIVLRALGMPLDAHRKLRVDQASLSTLAFRQNRTILASLNETCFLDR